MKKQNPCELLKQIRGLTQAQKDKMLEILDGKKTTDAWASRILKKLCVWVTDSNLEEKDREIIDNALNATLNALYNTYMVPDGEKRELFDEQLIYIKRILCEGRDSDVFVSLPTGYGKSVIYQLAGLLLNKMNKGGYTVVVSPLVALIGDQIDKLRAMDVSFYPRRLTRANANSLPKRGGFLYVRPEDLCQGGVIDRFVELPINLLVIDEAHCLSLWGYDFRPMYPEIRTLLRTKARVEKPLPIISAFTATATNDIQNDVIETLNMRNCKTDLKTISFKKREDLSIKVFSIERDEYNNTRRELDQEFENKVPEAKWKCKEGRIQSILKKVSAKDHCGVIFCRTTEEVEFLYSIFVNKREELGFGSDEDFIIQKYYARLQTENSITKADRLNQYLNAERGLMISTSAFGMGIDKEVAGIKYIIHYGLPYSMEDYYQQIGRAARKKKMDGECYVVYIKNKPAHYGQHMCEQTKNIISFLREKIVNIIFDKCPKSELNSDDDGSKEYVNDMLERYFMYFDMSVAIAVNTFRGKMKSNVYEFILKALEKNGISLDILSVKKGLFCKGLFWEIENDKAINDALGRHKPRKREEGIVLRQIENEKRIRMDDYDRVPVVFGHRSPLASFLEKGYTTGIVEFERKSKVYMDFTMEYREDEKKVFVGDEIPREKRVIAFDLILIDIVYTLRKYRLKTDTDTIIKTMFCSDTVRKDHRRELVNDRINVLSKLYIKYDMYPQKDPVETQVSPEEALLPLSKVKKTERNNNEFWFGESILTKLDSEKNTFYVLTCRDIRAGLYGYQYRTDKSNGEKVTFETVVLTYSILKRIKMFRLGRVSNVIKVFESISDIPVLELLNGVSKNRSDVDKMKTSEIKRAVKNIEKCIYGILDGFVDNKVIAGYTPADRVIRKSTDPDQENYGIKSIYVPLLCVPDQSSIHNRVLFYPNTGGPYSIIGNSKKLSLSDYTESYEWKSCVEALAYAFEKYAVENGDGKYLPDFIIKRLFNLKIERMEETSKEPQYRPVNTLPGFVINKGEPVDEGIITFSLRHKNQLMKKLETVENTLDPGFVSDVYSGTGLKEQNYYAFSREVLSTRFEEHKKYLQNNIFYELLDYMSTKEKWGEGKSGFYIKSRNNPIIREVLREKYKWEKGCWIFKK